MFVFVTLITLALICVSASFKSKSRAQSVSRPQVADHVVYRHVFHHVLALKKRAEEADDNGDDSTQYRTHFKRRAKLNDAEATLLEQVAIEYGEAEKILNARAKPILDAYKARFPNGQVLNNPISPPAELHSLSLERDGLVLRKRDLLRAAFGAEFERFDSLVKKSVADNSLRTR